MCVSNFKHNANYVIKTMGFPLHLDSVAVNLMIIYLSKIVVDNVTVTAKLSGKLAKRDVNITMTKEDGLWKLLYID